MPKQLLFSHTPKGRRNLTLKQIRANNKAGNLIGNAIKKAAIIVQLMIAKAKARPRPIFPPGGPGFIGAGRSFSHLYTLGGEMVINPGGIRSGASYSRILINEIIKEGHPIEAPDNYTYRQLVLGEPQPKAAPLLNIEHNPKTGNNLIKLIEENKIKL